MKKFYAKNFAYGAAALLVGAVGLTGCSSDDELTNVNPTYDGESVKTQFTINVPVKSPSTRLADDIVQTGGLTDFRGMNNIHMFAFSKTNQGAVADVTGTDTPTEVYGAMGSILNNELQTNTNAKVYYDINIPVGVNRFLFYGEATRAEGAKDADNGRLDATYPTTKSNPLSTTKFELVSIAEQGNTETEGTLLKALNDVAKVSGWSTSTELRNFYLSFIQLKAGSANSIREALTMLKEGLNSVTPSTEGDLKGDIIDAIDNSLGTITSLTYPRDLGLPDGAVQIGWNSSENEFEYSTSSNNVWGGMVTAAKIPDYVYPAALYYWTNSTIKVSDDTQSDNYATNWNTCLGLYQDGNTVKASTRSVALEKQINYGVARFDLAAWFNGTTVKDNVSNDVAVTEANGMKIVGLLVGGQKNVKYDFSTPVDDTERSIYDQSITSVVLPDSKNENIIARTLVLETEPNTTKRFAIELENNTGKSFVGNDGTVPAGGRFYLVGELEPSTDPTYVNMDQKVFKQDFTTTAKVTISSLAHAYNCIPDLKSPKLELGLSVDLDWQSGLVDDVTIE